MEIREWVLYPWFEERGASLVHPDDIGHFRRLVPYGKVFARIGEEGEYVVLLCGQVATRVKPDLIAAVPAPAFVYGQKVCVEGKGVAGAVVEIGWHHAKRRHFFHLEINGRRYGKRLWEEDLVSCG